MIHTFSNGLTLLAEPLDYFESVSFTLRIPAGSAYDPAARHGLSSLVCEMMLRGAGPWDNRELLERFDRIGIDRGESVTPSFLSFSGAMLAENLVPAMELYAAVVRQPHLPAEMLEASRMVLLQEVLAAEDDPSNQLMREMRERFYGPVFGHDPDGTEDSLEAMTLEDVRSHYARHVRPNGAILAVAGRFDPDALLADAERLFGDWPAVDVPLPGPSVRDPRGDFQIDYDSQQTHLALAWETVPFAHPDRLRAWAGISVLSGGMSSRLFTEVREKRGLCYTVDASCHTLKDRAGVFCYAATSASRADETLAVMLAEIEKLAAGVLPEELDSLKARYKSSLVMQQESCSAWCGGMAGDYYHLGRVRTKEEIQRAVDDLTLDAINEYLAAHPPAAFLCGKLGSE